MHRKSPVLDNPEAIADLLWDQNRLKSVETFQILLLNTRRRLIRVEQVSQGLLDTILVYPREVFQSAIAARAAAIVVVHNHLSGDPSPNEADIKVTRDLIRAGQLLKIEVLDHLVLGRAKWTGQKITRRCGNSDIFSHKGVRWPAVPFLESLFCTSFEFRFKDS